MGNGHTLNLLRDRHQALQEGEIPEMENPSTSIKGVASMGIPMDLPRRRRRSPGLKPGGYAALLLAVCRTHGPCTTSELIVRAWEAHPGLFGLRGFQLLHPDSNKVATYLFGARGLIRRGLLRRRVDGRLEATP